MEKIKLIRAEHEFYLYPEGISSIEQLVRFINKYNGVFLFTRKIDDKTCSFPYLFTENLCDAGINLSAVASFEEVEANFLSESEYNQRFSEYVQEYCYDCIYYEEERSEGLDSHKDHLTLGGRCFRKQTSYD